MVEEAVEPRRQLVADVREGDLADVPLGRDDEIKGPPTRQRGLRETPEDLAEPALDAIADNGVANLSRDGEPETNERTAVGQELEDEVVGVNADGLVLDAHEVAALEDAADLREGLAPGHPRLAWRVGRPTRLLIHFLGTDTVRRLRPLRRRADRTLRPPSVAMRARKPWVFLRLRLCG
jgi:hypothetical protein